MILDHISNRGSSALQHAGFAEAFSFIADLDPTRLAAGRMEIAGDRMYAVVVDGAGKGRSGAKLETHRNYIDIQYQVAGMDCIGWSPVEGLPGSGYDPEKDLEFHAASPASWILVPASCFAIFFPEDAHAPMGGDGRQLKVVVKVRV